MRKTSSSIHAVRKFIDLITEDKTTQGLLVIYIAGALIQHYAPHFSGRRVVLNIFWILMLHLVGTIRPQRPRCA